MLSILLREIFQSLQFHTHISASAESLNPRFFFQLKSNF